MTVFGHFLENDSLVSGNISSLDELDYSLNFLLRHHVQNKIRSSCFWPFCVQIRCLWCCFFIIILRTLRLVWLILHIKIDWTILYTFCLGTMPERKSGYPVFGHFVSKLDVFCTIFKFWEGLSYGLVFMSK